MFRLLGRGSIVILMGTLLFAAPVSAVEVEYALDFYSHYVWRGITLTDGPAFQPGITISHDSGFSFNTWGSFDLDDVNDHSGEFTELDLTIAYDFAPSDKFDFSLGVIEYTFPNTDLDTTREVFASMSWDVIAAPFFSIYYDFDEADDIYANFGIAFGGDFSDNVGWNLTLAAGYAGEDWAAFAAGGTDSGFFDGNVSFSVGFPVGENWSIGLTAAYSESLDEDVLPDQPADFYGGISIAGTF